MLPLSTKQLMQKSVAFKLSFSFTIALVIAVMVLGIVSSTVTCRKYYEYQSCYQADSYYSKQCTNGVTYCCSYSSNYCGDYYCRSLDSFSYYRRDVCWGIFIAMWICSGLAFFLAIFTFALFRDLRKKALYQNMIHTHFNSAAQLGYVPPVAFPQQNQPGPIQLNRTEYTEQNQRLF